MPGHDHDRMTRIAEDVSSECVDCNGNGRVDITDIFWLFTIP